MRCVPIAGRRGVLWPSFQDSILFSNARTVASSEPRRSESRWGGSLVAVLMLGVAGWLGKTEHPLMAPTRGVRSRSVSSKPVSILLVYLCALLSECDGPGMTREATGLETGVSVPGLVPITSKSSRLPSHV